MAANAPGTGQESRESKRARAGDCYDIIERGGARREASVDEADGAGPGVRRGGSRNVVKLRPPMQNRGGEGCGRRSARLRAAHCKRRGCRGCVDAHGDKMRADALENGVVARISEVGWKERTSPWRHRRFLT